MFELPFLWGDHLPLSLIWGFPLKRYYRLDFLLYFGIGSGSTYTLFAKTWGVILVGGFYSFSSQIHLLAAAVKNIFPLRGGASIFYILLKKNNPGF